MDSHDREGSLKLPPISKTKKAVPGKKYKFEVPPVPIPVSSIKETFTVDVVVLGAGSAGMVAAASAAEAGARTIVLEKYEKFAAPGGGIGAINAKDQLEQGLDTNIDAMVEKLLNASEGRADRRLIKTWAINSGTALDWLLDIAKKAGVMYTHMMGNKFLYTFGAFNLLTGVTLDFFTMLFDYGKNFGLEVRFNTQALQLVRPNNRGKIAGVITKNADGSYSQYNAAKAVIICTGDHGNNPEMMEKYAPWAVNCPNMYTVATNTGDGLQMALWAGAVIEDAPHCVMIHFNSTNAKPAMMNRPVTAGPNKNPYLYVNRFGERFANEAMPPAYLACTVLRQPGHTMWQVFDSKSITDRNKEAIKKALTTGEVLGADTIEALASKFRADHLKFKSAVNRYNEMAKMGKDTDFNKDSAQLGVTIDTPPYYVCESPPDLLVCMGGPMINIDAQVLDTDFHPIPGLYAAGNVTGGFWGDNYPMEVFAGIARGHAVTFGRIAGLNAAKFK